MTKKDKDFLLSLVNHGNGIFDHDFSDDPDVMEASEETEQILKEIGEWIEDPAKMENLREAICNEVNVCIMLAYTKGMRMGQGFSGRYNLCGMYRLCFLVAFGPLI